LTIRKTTRGRRQPHESARSRGISRQKLETLEDLHRAIRQREPEGSHLVRMLGTTTARLVDYLREPPGKITIRGLVEVRPGFKEYLKQRRYERNSIRTYCNNVRIFLQRARELGWVGSPPALLAAWRTIRQAVKKTIGCSRIVDYAVAQGKSPADFNEVDLTEWAQEAVHTGHVYEYVMHVKSAFRRLVFESGLNSVMPGLQPPVDNAYAVPFSDLPNPLRDQVTELLKWKTSDFVPGRPRRAKNRPITAENLRREMCRIYGFLTKIMGKKVSTLEELLSQESITAFVSWCLNERRVCGRSVETDLGRICGVRAYPALAPIDFSWVLELMAQLPRGRGAQIQEKKDRKWLDYNVLAAIPEQIRRDAARDRTLSEKAKAEKMRNALLLELMAVLPWRQRNVREAKVLPFDKGGNLYKERVPATSLWAQEAVRANPGQEIWQYHFRARETKTEITVRAPLPKQLVAPLEQYLACYRRVLLGKHRDPGTLFCSRRGRPFDRKSILRIVGHLTMKYAKVRTNPHLIRDIFALGWLRDHPDDYVTVMRTLWHRKIDTTLGCYAKGFDETDASVRIEEWLDKRKR
jgi:hypothetical protein